MRGGEWGGPSGEDREQLVAQLVLDAARRTRKKIKSKARKNRPDRGPKTAATAPAKPKAGASASAKRKPGREAAGQYTVSWRKRCFGGGSRVAPT